MCVCVCVYFLLFYVFKEACLQRYLIVSGVVLKEKFSIKCYVTVITYLLIDVCIKRLKFTYECVKNV